MSEETHGLSAFKAFLDERVETQGWDIDQLAKVLQEGYDIAMDEPREERPVVLDTLLRLREFFKDLTREKRRDLCKELLEWVDDISSIKTFLHEKVDTRASALGIEELAIKIKKDYDYARRKPREHRPLVLDARISVQGFFKDLPEEKLRDLCKELLEWMNPAQPSSSERRFVGIDFKVTDSALTHTFDLSALQAHVEHVFSAYYDSSVKQSNKEDRYHAPYFCFIQSSGMGKTKLMYEYAQASVRKPDALPIVKLILCRPKRADEEKHVFDAFLDLSQEYKSFEEHYNHVNKFLSYLLETRAGEGEALVGRQVRDVVLLFDEAHYLTRSGGIAERKMEGFWFRVIRLWLRRKRKSRRVVAVFGGTTSKLSKFRFADDLHGELETDTRAHTSLNVTDFHPAGSKLFDPFYTTTTIGCLRRSEVEENSESSEYHKSVVYGRPLFEMMLRDNELTDTTTKNILKRMLLLDENTSGTDWANNDSCCLNILASRIQMGQTTTKIASELVSHAYANLVNVDGEYLRIYYPPDPVCARLSMCLMDENYSCQIDERRTINGLSRKNWAQKISLLFSNRIFTVEKGDFGEVLVAFYFLLCADEVRCSNSPNDYSTFSVPLGEWIGSLVKDDVAVDADAMDYSGEEDADDENGSEENETVGVEQSNEMDVDDLETPSSGKRKRGGHKDLNNKMETSCHTSDEDPDSTLFFSAIQVCRNYFREYASDWKTLCDQSFLHNMYTAAVGCYTFAGCATMDCMFSLALRKSSSEPPHGYLSPHGYLPMFVSVKSQEDFTEGAADKECEALLKKAKSGRPEYGALCLVVIFGAHRNTSPDTEARLQDTKKFMNDLQNRNCVARVLRIPLNDRFGLSNVFSSMTSVRDEIAEILTSHCFVSYDDKKSPQGSPEEDSNEYAVGALRKSTRKKEKDEPMEMLSKLATQLKFAGEKKNEG